MKADNDRLIADVEKLKARLREEIVTARRDADGELDYDTLMGLPYLDAVCRETLRVFPPLNFMQRV